MSRHQQALTELYPTPDNPVPEGATVAVITAADGVGLRAARWPATADPARGTVCLFTGWGEQIERYFPVIEALRRRGFAVAVLDWRGQGGSERLAGNPRKGHVGSFAAYRRDVEAFRSWVRHPDCPGPHFAVAHSMGGNVLLSAAPDLDGWIVRLVLSAPMLGLPTRHLGAGGIRLTTRLLRLIGLGRMFAPGQVGRIRRARLFEHNGLTSDPDRYARLAGIVAAHPELSVSAPTVAWVSAAQAAIDRLGRDGFAARVSVPVMMVNCGGDRVVPPRTIETMARRLRSPAYVLVPGARHEILAEAPRYAAQFWAAFDAFVPGSSGL